LREAPFVAMMTGDKNSEYRRRNNWIEARLFDTRPPKNKKDFMVPGEKPYWYVQDIHGEDSYICPDLFKRRLKRQYHYVEFTNKYDPSTPKFAMEYKGVRRIERLPKKKYWNGLTLSSSAADRDGNEVDHHYELKLGKRVYHNKAATDLVKQARINLKEKRKRDREEHRFQRGVKKARRAKKRNRKAKRNRSEARKNRGLRKKNKHNNYSRRR
jgi:hypothetical protein